MRNRTITIFLIFLSGVVLFAAYWSGLHGGFFFDDQPNILELPALRVSDFSLDSLIGVWKSGKSGPYGRPIAQMSFAVNYYFDGFDPFDYKLFNLVIHFLNSLLVMFLFRRLLRAVEPMANIHAIALASGLLAAAWLFHPLQLTSVLYVVQRMTSLSALFLLVALLLHVRMREEGGGVWQLFAAWFLFWPLSFLSKENGVLFPFFVVAWELTVRRATVGRIDRLGAVLSLMTALASALATAYLLSPAGQLLISGYAQRHFSLAERLLTEGRVIWQYLGLTVFPQLELLGLYHDDIQISKGLFQPWTTLAAAVGLLVLAATAYRVRKSNPLVSFGVCWFLIGHSLESSFLPLEIMHEHRNYLPMAGPMLVAAWACLRMIVAGEGKKRLAIGLVCAFLTYLLFVTSLRSHQFGDEFRRTQIEAQHHRGSARSQYEAGRTLAVYPEADQADSIIHSMAKAHFERATEADPNFKLGLLGVIDLECRAASSVSEDTVNELARRLATAPYAPGDNAVLFSLKEMALAKRLCIRRVEFELLFNSTVKNPSATVAAKQLALSWLADYFWLAERDLAAAKRVLLESLVIAPMHPSSRLKLAQVQLLGGNFDDAAKLLRDLRGATLSIDEERLRRELMAGLGMVSHD